MIQSTPSNNSLPTDKSLSAPLKNSMCGIAGGAKSEKLIKHMDHRGSDTCLQNGLAHRLHSVIGELEQPIEEEGNLTTNCEIYNWKQLNEDNGWKTENDAETLLKMLDKYGKDAVKQLEGIYAFAYKTEDQIIIARDLLGINPVWYSEDKFAFASEKQALEKEGFEPRELNPRQILIYNREKDEIQFESRDFYDIDEKEIELEEAAEEVAEKFLEAIEKRVPNTEVAVLFSGGVDSTLVAAALQELNKEFTAYTSGIQYGNTSKPRDVEWAEKIADKMDIELEVNMATLEDVEESLPKISEWLSSANVIKNSVALPMHFALSEKGSEKVVFTGLGSEHIYAGYRRQGGYLNKECLSDLRSVYHEDLYRDNVVCFRNGRELRVPFLDDELVRHALTLPEELKVNADYRKLVLRKAAEKIGVPEEVVWRGKVAAQYGSNFDKAISKLAKDNGFDQKQKYLNSFREVKDKKLAALTSGGKDSNAALYRMQRRNNTIECLVSLTSSNKESYMFDTRKQEEELERQSEELGIPLLLQETEGEKEDELEDLRTALRRAKDKYGVEGITAGAIESTYQRDRVDKVADNLGLKVFAPLWQFDQSHYMKWLIRNGFKVQITKVAARGLDEIWEGKVLDEEGVEELLELAEEYRFNPAGEGGEYETRVKGFPNELV
jgi:diphthine-ammonia ligase